MATDAGAGVIVEIVVGMHWLQCVVIVAGAGVVLGGVIVIVECMARIFIYFHIHIYTHLRYIASYMSALKTSSTDTLQPAL